MKEFIDRAYGYDGEDRDTFAIMIREAYTLLGCSTFDLALEFNTGAGTIGRWMAGLAAPPIIARRAIINHLGKLIDFASKFGD